MKERRALRARTRVFRSHIRYATRICVRICVYICVYVRIVPPSPFRSLFRSHSFSPLSFFPSHASNETFRAPPACLEPFTPCWVSHRNLLRPHFHPRGSRRRENPSDLVVVVVVAGRVAVIWPSILSPSPLVVLSTLSPIVPRRARWRSNPSRGSRANPNTDNVRILRGSLCTAEYFFFLFSSLFF